MENIKIKKNANNIMWVEYWIQKAHPSFEVNDKIEDDYHMSNMTVCYDKDGDSVIVEGYASQKRKEG